jgi:hypothetical protein
MRRIGMRLNLIFKISSESSNHFSLCEKFNRGYSSVKVCQESKTSNVIMRNHEIRIILYVKRDCI